MKATHTGNNFNQQNSISWSYLNLGNVALNQTNKKQKTQVLSPKIIDCKLIIVVCKCQIDWDPVSKASVEFTEELEVIMCSKLTSGIR